MKLNHLMESLHSPKEKEERISECEKITKNGENPLAEKEGQITFQEIHSSRLDHLRWDNLIHIDLQFYINDFLVSDDLLWERGNRDLLVIKEFSMNYLKEKVLVKENGKCIVRKEIGSFTWDFLELASEYMTRRISEEIKFYDCLNPFEVIRDGIFGVGTGLENEHLININVNISHQGYVYQDSFEWNILSVSDVPEKFAEQLSQDLNLPPYFIELISLNIRKKIKEYVFDLFNTFTKRFVSLKEEHQKLDFDAKKIIQSQENILTEKKKTVPQKNSIFATYNANSPPVDTTPNLVSKPWKNYTPPTDPMVFDDLLPSPLYFLFDTELEKLLAAKPFKVSTKTSKPEFLKNKVPRRSNRKLDETNFNIAQSNLLCEYNIYPPEYIKIEKKPKLKTSVINKPIKKKNSKTIDLNKLNSIEFRNPHILEIRGSAIVISKNVLPYSDRFEKILIYKKDIEPYMNLHENKFQNGHVKIEETHNKEDEGRSKDHIGSAEKSDQYQTKIEIENLIFSTEKNEFENEEEKAFQSQESEIKILEVNGIFHDQKNVYNNSNGLGIYLENNQET